MATHSNFKQPLNVIASQRVGAKRRPMTGSAKQSMEPQESLDCFVASLLAMTPDTASRSRRTFRARFARNVPPSEDQRAQGMPGAQCARSLACKIKQAYEHSHHGHTGFTRHSPRNGFTAYFALSPVTRLV